MRGGKLDKYVQIQSSYNKVEEDGSFAPCWRTDASIWASIEPATGREVTTGDRRQADVTHVIKVRARKVRPNQRIQYGDRVFDIEAVRGIDDRDDTTTILARELVETEVPTDA